MNYSVYRFLKTATLIINLIFIEELPMKVMNIFLVMLTFLFLSGCELHQVKGEVGGVEVEAQTKESKTVSENEGKFCPPGQAKKGNC